MNNKQKVSNFLYINSDFEIPKQGKILPIQSLENYKNKSSYKFTTNKRMRLRLIKGINSAIGKCKSRLLRNSQLAHMSSSTASVLSKEAQEEPKPNIFDQIFKKI